MIDFYIKQYGRRLYGLCRALCGNSFDADDLYQETWLKVVRCIGQYDTAREFEPWLTKICVNTYRTMLRHMLKSPFRQFSSREEQEQVLENIPAEEKKDYSALYEAVACLPEKLRITVILFYFRDLDTAKTAAVLGIPVGTVKSRLNKARRLLKEVLIDETELRF